MSIIVITADPGPDTSGGFVYAPTELTAVAEANTGSLEMPVWNVSLADGSTFTPTIVDKVSGLTVSFSAPVAGSYTFRVSFPNAGCEGMSSIDVHSRNANQASYRLRVAPPETDGIPQQDLPLTVYGGMEKSDANLALVSGTPILSTLRGPGGTPTAGEVRLIADSGPDAVGLAGDNGTFALAVSADALYTPLLVPTGANAALLAPRLLAKANGLTLVGASFTVDAGQTVSGSVRDPANAAIAGAHVVLRNGLLPSGARPQRRRRELEPAGGAGQLRRVARRRRLARAVVVGRDRARRAAGARREIHHGAGGGQRQDRRLRRRPPRWPARASRCARRCCRRWRRWTSGSGAAPVGGRVKQLVVSAADGTLPPLQLPVLSAGNYDILIEPPAGSSDGVTSLSMALPAPRAGRCRSRPRFSSRAPSAISSAAASATSR